MNSPSGSSDGARSKTYSLVLNFALWLWPRLVRILRGLFPLGFHSFLNLGVRDGDDCLHGFLETLESFRSFDHFSGRLHRFQSYLNLRAGDHSPRPALVAASLLLGREPVRDRPVPADVLSIRSRP